jgi:predicted ATPase
MLVAISGAQGSGKSTVLSKIKQMGYNTVDRKTSRSILSDWDVSLQEVNNNPQLTVRFQEEIILRKFKDEQDAIDSKELWFTERSYIDLLTYSIVSLGKDNDYSPWINEYAKKCISLHQEYNLVFYIQSGFFNPEHDGVRGSNQFYSRMVDLTMSDLLYQNTLPTKLIGIETPQIDQRVFQIITMSESALL